MDKKPHYGNIAPKDGSNLRLLIPSKSSESQRLGNKKTAMF